MKIREQFDNIVLQRHIEQYDRADQPHPEDATPDDLFNYNVKFALKIANEYGGDNLDHDSVVQECLVGLWIAANRFDKSVGSPFISYAKWWMRAQMTRYLARMAQQIKLPENQWIRSMQLHRGRDWDEALEACESDQDRAAVLARSGVVPLDTPVNGMDGLTIGDSLAYSDEDVVESVAHHQVADVIDEAIDRLPARHAKILRQTFGIGGDEPVPMTETAKEMGLSQERIRQIKEMGMFYIRSNADGEFSAVHAVADDLGIEITDRNPSVQAAARSIRMRDVKKNGIVFDDSEGRPEVCPACGHTGVRLGAWSANSGNIKRRRYYCKACGLDRLGVKEWEL